MIQRIVKTDTIGSAAAAAGGGAAAYLPYGKHLVQLITTSYLTNSMVTINNSFSFIWLCTE